MAEFARGALQQYDYASVPGRPGDDAPFYVYQIIAKQTKDILVDTIGAPSTDATTWLFHPMDVHVDPTSESSDTPEWLDVSAVASASVYSSVFAVSGDDVTGRGQIYRWGVCEPRLGGCVGLRGKQAASSRPRGTPNLCAHISCYMSPPPPFDYLRWEGGQRAGVRGGFGMPTGAPCPTRARPRSA